jgi:hypothetical protein
MSSNRERQQWTQFVEQREREKQPKRPRRKKEEPKHTQAELEKGLDDLISAATGETNARNSD